MVSYIRKCLRGSNDPSIDPPLCIVLARLHNTALSMGTNDDSICSAGKFAPHQCLQLVLINIPILYDLLYGHYERRKYWIVSPQTDLGSQLMIVLQDGERWSL